MADSAEFKLGIAYDPLKKGLAAATDLFKSFGNNVVGKIKSSFSVLLKEIPLFGASFEDGLAEGMSHLKEMDDQLFSMRATIEGTGNAAGVSTKKLEEMSKALRDNSTFSSTAIAEAQGLALQFRNVKGDMFEKSLKSAADYAAVMKKDLPSAASLFAESLNNPIEGFDKLKNAGVAFLDREKLVVEQLVYSGKFLEAQEYLLNRVAEGYGGKAAEKAETFTGKLERLNNKLKDMWSVVADAVSPAFDLLIPMAESGIDRTEKLANSFKGLLESIVKWVKDSWPLVESWFKSFVDAAKKVAETGIDYGVKLFTYLETAATNLPAFFEKMKAELSVVWAKVSLEGQSAWEKLTVAIENMWNKMMNSVKQKMADMVGYLFKIPGVKTILGIDDAQATAVSTAIAMGALGSQKATDKQASGPSSAELDYVAQLEKDAEAAGADFNKAYEENLDKNQKKFGEFTDKMLSFLGIKEPEKTNEEEKTSEASVSSPFVLDESDLGAGKGGGTEDLLSLNKRIQGAAAKTPDVLAIEEQSMMMQNNHNAMIKATADLNKSVTDVSVAVNNNTMAVKEQDRTSRYE